MKKINRRSFIKKILLGAAAVEIGYLTYDTLESKIMNKSKKELFKAGKIQDFEKNKIYPFSSGKFYLSVLEDGGMLAFSMKCTHLGCIVQSDGNKFECPCHSSVFDKYGRVLSPPATRALDIFPIKINNSEILVDTNNPIKRKSFEKSQISYA